MIIKVLHLLALLGYATVHIAQARGGQSDFQVRSTYSCCDSYIRSKCGCSGNTLQCHDITGLLTLPREYYCESVQIVSSNVNITHQLFERLKTDQLILSDNHLEDVNIRVNAFDSLANTLRMLVLSNNNLTSLPKSISNLAVLQHLDVSGNPIIANNFDNEVMKSIGDKLTYFSFGSHMIHTWPTTLSHLQDLQELNVTGGNFTLISENAFHGFEGTLLHLTIMNTNLNSVPLAISRAKFLKSLHFDNNHNVGDYGMNIPKIENLMPFLINVSLKEDNITKFPDALSSFPKLIEIILDRNDIEFIGDESGRAVQNVTRLSLKQSGLIRIPGALREIRHLSYLDLSDNDIHNIDYRDTRFLNDLQTLKMNNNPIVYISKYAFIYNHEISTLEMRNANLTRVPCAIIDLFRRQQDTVTLDLSNNKIDCNCDLRWLYEKQRESNTIMNIKGNCETVSMTIEDYINNELPLCPESSSSECRYRT